LRYVDDAFVIWPYGEEELEQFHQHLNSIHPNIQFTKETEENRSLPYLDVLITKNRKGGFSHTTYRKPTHTNRYLHATFHRHPAHLNEVLRTLIHRARLLTDKQHEDDDDDG
ncbi:MAG: hypothetical protein ACTS41_01600, partial [Candidatus Hodgkinia cicadicola]